jgi:hypothetical protein
VAVNPQADWTIETVREHVLALMDERDKRYEQRFLQQETAVTAALNSSKEAVAKAERATEKRFESVNEFRGALSDAQKNYITRSEAIALVVVVCAVIEVIINVFNYFMRTGMK